MQYGLGQGLCCLQQHQQDMLQVGHHLEQELIKQFLYQHVAWLSSAVLPAGTSCLTKQEGWPVLCACQVRSQRHVPGSQPAAHQPVSLPGEGPAMPAT